MGAGSAYQAARDRLSSDSPPPEWSDSSPEPGSLGAASDSSPEPGSLGAASDSPLTLLPLLSDRSHDQLGDARLGVARGEELALCSTSLINERVLGARL